MKNYTKKSLKASNGITLIALVITIIVLLILAGISISMLSGDNSILQKATDAKQASERAEAKEQAQMDIMAWITGKTANHQDASLDDSKVKDILTDKSYVKEAKKSSFITAKGEYEIPYSELYQSNGSNNNNNDNPSESPLDVLIGKQKSEILLKKSIPIDATTSARFYDCNFTTCDDYIEYNGEIYKVSYNVDYDGENRFATSIVTSVTATDIDIYTLGRSGDNIVTIAHGNSTYYDETSYFNYVGLDASGLVEDTLFGLTYLFPYKENGILAGYPMCGNYDDDFGEHGYTPMFPNPTD